MYFFWLRDTRPVPSAPAQVSPAAGMPGLTPEEAREFERIRIKVEFGGPQSLTPKEQDFLDRLRERVLRA
jgi:hypothetical protein